MTENTPSSYEDEIDLRAILQTLWKARVIILICVLVPAIVAFAASKWFRPALYQASAYVFIGNPPVEFAEISNVPFSPNVPDITAVVQLATTPGLLENVVRNPAVLDTLGVEQATFLSAIAVAAGRDQLRLQVTDTNPQHAAILANAWAAKVVDAVNATYYGMSNGGDSLDSQLAQSHQNYEQAQAALEMALSQSQADALNLQLQNKQAELLCTLNAESNILRLLDDLEILEGKWDGIPFDTPVSLDDALVLTTLRQRSQISQPCQSFSSLPVPGLGGLTLQIDNASIANITVSDALTAVAEMRSALDAQVARLQSEQEQLEGEIPQLQASLEKERSSLTQMTLKRDQAYSIYSDFFKQQEHAANVLGHTTKVGAMVSVPASTPQGKVSRNVMRNTLVIAFLGLALSVFAVLFVDWWRSERPFPV